jgi:hypothetical protein
MTQATPSEQADLVDVGYVPFVRPLGNLVILFKLKAGHRLGVMP